MTGYERLGSCTTELNNCKGRVAGARWEAGEDQQGVKGKTCWADEVLLASRASLPLSAPECF